ncbi:hypothetical protein J6590_108633 [Homalodisca vitripennis]|nr:hypothetical protein J6590_108633 [Homalodisca vitripennis]
MEMYDDTWFQNKTKEEVVKEIHKLRKNIKNKHKSIEREQFDTEELWEKQLKPVSEPLKKMSKQEENEEEEDNNRINVRKQKLFKTEIECDSVPVKLRVVDAPQGLKRKQKINLPTKHDFESDYEYDDGTLDIPNSKRGATQIPNDNNSDMEAVGTDEEEEEMETTTAVTPARSDVFEQIYQTRPTGEEYLKTPEGRQLAKYYIKKTFTGKIAKEYFSKLITGSKHIDHNLLRVTC